ncbi:MAG: neutral/alkaline non-lysosomal ceramidase N-terminal domain-containing protein, partial [Hyphomicrobiaceae bacterium]|nr:neutral/alkaline non-lysosomal ceramidase N-terminal domain-containing protein [Hyphomicrobiaceae bacterium]
MSTQVDNRREFLKSMGFGAATFAGSHWLSADERIGREWLVGYAEADITPAPGQAQMRGYGRERYAKGTLAPLLSQVLALRDRKGNTCVLITADIAAFDRVLTEAIRRAITRRHGIPAERIMLNASHTHWGPAACFHAIYAAGAPNVWYMGVLEDKIMANVKAAMENMLPATIEYGWLDFRGIGCCRRMPVNGRITWGAYREGSFDGHTPILRIKRNRSPRQLLIVGHGCHPTSSGKIEKWSPDYPGAMRDYLIDKLTDTRSMFVQGCGGDAKVVHKDSETGKLVFTANPERSREAGEKLALAVLAYLEKERMKPLGGELACALVTGKLSYGERWSQEEVEKHAYTDSGKGYHT